MVDFHAELIDFLPKFSGSSMHNVSSTKILLKRPPRLVAIVPIYATSMTFLCLVEHGHKPHPILTNKNRSLILNVNQNVVAFDYSWFLDKSTHLLQPNYYVIIKLTKVKVSRSEGRLF